MSGNNWTLHDTFQRGSRRQRQERLSTASTLLVCAGLLLGIPNAVYASSIAASNLSFSNLQITASSGTIQFQGPWTSQAFASAENSLGGLDQEFASNIGAASTIAAIVTFANASGTANVAPLSGTASDSASIPGTTAQAITSSYAALSNSFEITGGTGLVNVTFSNDLSGLLQVGNDQNGVLATAEAIFALQVDGMPILFLDSPLSAGPSASATLPISQSLTNTISLTYGTPYAIYVEADAESSAYNVVPEPPTAVLLFTALLGITGITACAGYGGTTLNRVSATISHQQGNRTLLAES